MPSILYLSTPIQQPDDGKAVVINANTGTVQTRSFPSNFTQNIAISSPAVGNFSIFRCNANCTLGKIFVLKKGGASLSFNARKNKTSTHIATNAVINTDDNFVDVGTLQNTTYQLGDELEIQILGTSGTIDYISIQAEFTLN
jgi:hypothetical protein